MSYQQDIEAILAETLEDSKLSAGEKFSLRVFLDELDPDVETLNFVRNRAFQLVGERMRDEFSTPSHLLKWLEQIVKAVDNFRNSRVAIPSVAYFSPGNSCADHIIELLQRAKKSVDVCVFTISDNRISRALLSAHQRGIKVRIITDNDKSNDRGSDVHYLADQGLSIRMDTSPSHMHHKFAIFDNRQLVNGSFNWTRSASDYNQENIVVSGDPSVISSFYRAYQKLWSSCKSI